MNTLALPKSVLRTITAPAAHGTFEFGLFDKKNDGTGLTIRLGTWPETASPNGPWNVCSDTKGIPVMLPFTD